MIKHLFSISFLLCFYGGVYSQSAANKAINKVSVKASAPINNTTANGTLAAPPCIDPASAKLKVFNVCEGSLWTLEITDVNDATYTDPGYSWLWTGPNGFTSDKNPTEEFFMSSLRQGIYSVTINSPGCTEVKADVFNVIVKLSKTTPLLPVVCQGDTYILPDGTMANTSLPTTFNALYYFTSAGQPSCPDDSVVTVSMLIKPKYNITINDVLCPGISYTLPNGNSVNTPGTYPVALNTINGCDSTITTVLTDGTGINTVNDIVCPAKPYLLPDGTTTTIAGNYPVTLVNAAASGCDSTITTILTDGRGIKTVNDIICAGKLYTLPDGTTATGAGTYNITLPIAATNGCDSVISTVLKTIIIKPTIVNSSICKGDTLTLPDGTQITDEGAYPITFMSQTGCDSIVNYNIKVAPLGELLLPNSFTPNNDTRNDCFGLRQLPLTTNIRFDIYSRWGQLVFTSSSPDACWDGTYKNIQLPTGAYVWFLKTKTACGDRQQKGTVLLLR